MTRRGAARAEYGAAIGLPVAVAIVVVAQILEGAPVRALWQPTAALVVLGGTTAAVFISYPAEVVRRTLRALRRAFIAPAEPVDALLARIVQYANTSRRRGLLALEPEIERTADPFLRSALGLAVDGTNTKTARHILEVESQARFEHDEGPAEVLETAAGYAPTLGILGAVLGLIHVMQSLSEPARLGNGIAVAFVATVYGVASANLVLLPLATRLRGIARLEALKRDVIIEGMSALQEGLNPRLVEQKLQGFVAGARRSLRNSRVA